MAIETPARIAVLGAGPIGLEAALYARCLGYDVDLYERGRVAQNVRQWGHVRMFSPFSENRSPLALAALRTQDPAWQPPADDALLTGREFADRFLVPLARSDLLIDSIHEQTQVVAVGRDGLLKGEMVGEPAREECDFRIVLRSTKPGDHGRERITAADAVIDTTGTYATPNWLGHGGVPALGELAAANQIEYGLPDVLGDQRDRYASRSILLVGAGHSAATNLVALAELAGQAPDTWITWVTREACDPTDPQPIRRTDDRFGQRDRLAHVANRLAADDANHVTLLDGTSVDALAWHADLQRFSVRLLGAHAGDLEFDRIIANVGYRPDISILSELDVEPLPIAKGASALVQREPDYYLLGAKSYARDSQFLIVDGLEQIRALFTIIGDRTELNLYATMAGLH